MVSCFHNPQSGLRTLCKYPGFPYFTEHLHILRALDERQGSATPRLAATPLWKQASQERIILSNHPSSLIFVLRGDLIWGNNQMSFGPSWLRRCTEAKPGPPVQCQNVPRLQSQETCGSQLRRQFGRRIWTHRLDSPRLVLVGVRVPTCGCMKMEIVTHSQARWTNQTKARLINTRLPFISQLTI